MRSHAGAVLGAGLATVLGLSVAIAPAGGTGASAAPAHREHASRASVALDRLRADTRGTVRVSRGPQGLARLVSVEGEAPTPPSRSATTPRIAARAQLARYGALVGVDRPGTRLVGGTVRRTATGDRVVRFAQRRDGIPVVAGSVAVDVRPDGSLSSMAASVSTATVPSASYPRAAARRTALAVATKELGPGAHATPLADRPVRRLYDPAVLGTPRTSDPATWARGVWWVEVHAGPAFHLAVLVDDQSGANVLDIDLVERLDRVVCDNDNATDQLDVPCTKKFARTEGQPATGNPDVDDAYDFAGVVSSYYREIGRIDLTRLLGVDEGDHLSLSSTVRFCEPAARADTCPLANAFWNGVGMFYGQGFASADDVVGHEMTHGVIQHNSDLFYWGQSGAINESLADVMGEIIDHRHRRPGDSPHSWTLGEDLPIGAVRSLKDPPRFGQPQKMTSKLYVGGVFDNGGVHFNSCDGNRTFYLISQGGKQGGHTVRGIDGRKLTKTAVLALDVIRHLVSGSDYRDLAAQLQQSCRSLARHHRVGFTTRDCRSVHQATLATELRTMPPKAKRPPDAPMTCPRGTGQVRVLFDSEKGTPRTKFDAGTTWLRAPDSSAFPPAPANATSGHSSWFSQDPEDSTVSSLVMHPAATPAGRPVFLWFHQWRLLDFGTRTHRIFDGGTVEVADATRGGAPRPAEGLRWVNGPHNVITDEFDNPAGGRESFGADSHGYLASRLTLDRYAGHAVSPQFTMNTDTSNILPGIVFPPGWYLDDIRVYTCGSAVLPRSVPTVTGTPAEGSTLTAGHGRWSGRGLSFRYHWYAGGVPIPGAGHTAYTVKSGDVGKRLTVKVTAVRAGRAVTSTFSAATTPVTGP